MIYQVTTSGLRKERQNTDNSSILRIYNVGDYPVQIRINEGSFYDPIIRNQHIDITRTATPVEFKAIGGDTLVRTYRVYGDNIDECDIDGILDYDNVTISDEYVQANFVQLKNIAQDLNSPNPGTIPSTEAVYKSIEETLSKIGKVLVFRGTVTTFDDLPDNALYGDTYNVVERHGIYGPGTNYAWDGSKWDALGSAALDVQAEENFKKLVEDSTSEFVNVVEDATAQINTSIADAKSFSENAYANAQDAYYYRGEAEYFATKAESKAQETSAIKVQVEEALSKAEAVVDPEGLSKRITSNTLNLDSGELLFRGGYAKNDNAFKSSYDSISICVSVRITEKPTTAVSRLFSIGNPDITNPYDAFGLVLDYNSTNKLYHIKAGFSFSAAKHSELSSLTKIEVLKAVYNNNFFDGNLHTIVCTFTKGKSIDLYLDGVLVNSKTAPSYAWDLIDQLYGYGLGCRNDSSSKQTFACGNLSRVKVFNFNIADSNAVYTIKDYHAGKPIPNVLVKIPFKENVAEVPVVSGMPSYTDAPQGRLVACDRAASITTDGTKITWTATANVAANSFPKAIVYKFDEPILGSGVLKVNLGNITQSGTVLTTLRIGYLNSAIVNGVAYTNLKFNAGEQTIELPFANQCTGIVIGIGSGSAYSSGYSFTIDSLKLYFDGKVLLHLEDVVLNNTIKDTALGYDATISGFIADNRNYIENKVLENEAFVSQLQLCKANIGALHFNDGGYAQCSKLLRNQQFSFAVRIKANKNDVLTGKQVNIIDTGVFYLYIHSSVQRLSVYATGNSLKSVTVEQNDRIFDGNWHSLFVTYDGIMLTLLDEFGVLLTADYSIQEQTSNTKIGANFVGEMSNVCLFNFDITSEDAPYTLADYQQGKPIQPSLLLGGGNRFNIVGAVQDTNYKVTGYNCTGSITQENGVYTIGKGTITEGQTNIQSYLLFKLSSTIKAGSKVKINLKRSGTNKLYLIRLTKDALSNQSGATTGPDYLNVVSETSWNGDDLINNTLISTIDCNGASFQLGNTFDTFSFTDFSIEVNGTVLALEDYTFDGEVLDYSGNNNHAIITGDVKGDNDNKVETLYQKIAARISNNS